jgi:hypothetical protein
MTAEELLAKLEEEGLAVCRLTLTRAVEQGGEYLWFPVDKDELARLLGEKKPEDES